MQSNLLKSGLITLGFLAFFASTIYIFTYYFERYEEPVDSGWSREARFDRYLAAQQYLSAQGINTKRVENVEQIINKNELNPTSENGSNPERVATIFLSNSRSILSQKSLDLVIDWVQQGGHLIFAADTPNEKGKDYLLDYFELTPEYYQYNYDDNAEEELREILENTNEKNERKLSEELEEFNEKLRERKKKAESDKNTEEAASGDEEANNDVDEDNTELSESTEEENPRLTKLSFDGEDDWLFVGFYRSRTLYHPYFYYENETEDAGDFEGLEPIYWRGTEEGIHFIQFELGDGLVSVLSDGAIWRNHNIDNHDNAYLLNMLVSSRGAMRFLTDIHMPPITKLFMMYAQEFAFVGLLLILAWARYSAQRFGPITPHITTSRRSIAEHIQATGLYLWKGRWHDDLLDPLRRDILKGARLTFPNYDQLKESEQYQILSRHSGVDIKLVAYAMGQDIKHNEEEFCKVVQYLQRIKDSL